jgi:hypothetical protein
VSELNHTKLRNAVSEFKNVLLLHLVSDINHTRLPDLASDFSYKINLVSEFDRYTLSKTKREYNRTKATLPICVHCIQVTQISYKTLSTNASFKIFIQQGSISLKKSRYNAKQ